MGIITVKKAKTIADLNAAARVRCSVFADELTYLDPADFPAGREVDGFDVLPTTVNFLGLVDGNPVATVRLLFPNEDVAARCNIRFGLNIERYLELQRIGRDMTLAEIPRSSVLEPFRRTGVMRHLYFAAYVECLRQGATHWVAVGNTQTDCEADARVIQCLLEARGFWLPQFGARPRKPAMPGEVPRYPLYGTAARQSVQQGFHSAVPLPRTLELFAEKLGVRYFGAPFYDSDFRMYAMPLIMSMHDFMASPYGAMPQAA